jgi:polysaccharide biosynthesis transport protein
VFRTSDQVETHLQTDCIALVPVVKTGAQKKDIASLRQQTDLTPLLGTVNEVAQKTNLAPGGRTETQIAKAPNLPDPGQRKLVVAPGVLSAAADSPFSAFAEALRSIKVAIDLSPATGAGGKIIGFTSSVPNEGKSSLACVLALLIAQTGSKTLLVDCDLRNPSLSRTLSPGAAGGGLLDVLAGKAMLEQAIWQDTATGLRFLPVATKARLAHSSEIIASHGTQSLFDKLRQSFDYVIVDFAPLMPIVDVRASMHLVDSYVYVIEWGRTRIEHVEQALRSARGVHEHLLGVVLNKVDLGALGRYGGPGAGYYRDESYSRYGYTE